MGGYSGYVVLAAVGVGLVWLLLTILRGRRASRTDVSPVSDQWLAERRGKQD
jgi:heme exporter protein D